MTNIYNEKLRRRSPEDEREQKENRNSTTTMPPLHVVASAVKPTRHISSGLHKEGRGPSYVKPSDRRVFFTRDALDKWMAGWDVVIR